MSQYTHLVIGEALSDEQLRETVAIMNESGSVLKDSPDLVSCAIDIEEGGAMVLLTTVWRSRDACLRHHSSRAYRQLVTRTQHLLVGNFVIKIFRRESGRSGMTVSAPTRVALYARVSTKNNGQDPRAQIELLREYASRRGWEIANEYVDEGFSGAKSDRPALQRLMKDAKRRAFDVVAVWKFDRFGRSLRDLVNSLEEFKSLGIEFVSLTEAIDTSSPLGHVMFALIGAMAQFERELIRERVMMGLERAKRQGKRIGRPRVEVDPEKLRQLRAEGLSLRAIGKATGVSSTTVMEMLRKS